jgi:hypothetical protein
MKKIDEATRKQAKAIVDKSPKLKALKSYSEGEKYSEISTGVNDQAYKDGYDKINWGKKKTKPKFKVRINGVYQDDDTR